MEKLVHLAELIKKKNEIDSEIASIIDRPATIGHVGEYIASKLLKIQLEQSASQKGIDGYFVDGPLVGKSVNIKWYTKRSGLLDITPESLPDYYLVLTGPRAPASSSKGTILPWVIQEVFLFNSDELVQSLRARKVKIGIATSVVSGRWEKAMIYPHGNNHHLSLTDEQIRDLSLFK
jgi:hypothetical protein